MAKKRKVKGKPHTEKPRRAGMTLGNLVLLVAGLLVAGIFFLTHFLHEPPAVPDPDVSAMEPQVAAKIAASRDRVAEQADSAENWGRLGMVFQAHGLQREAATAYGEARRLDPFEFRWPYLQAQALKEVRELVDAVQSLDAAIEIEKRYAPLFVLRAFLHEQAGAFGEAMASYRAALAVDPSCVVAEFGLGRLKLNEDEREESLGHLERAKQLQPDAGAIRATLARLYRRLGDREKALAEAERARDLEPEVGLNDPVMAEVAEEAVSVVGLQDRAGKLEERGESARAEALLRHVIELRPAEADLYYNLANNLSRQGRPEQAESLYRKTLELDPEHVSALINLGILHGQRRDLVEADRLYQLALTIEPDHPAALSGLGNVTALKGQLVEAEELFRRSLDADPTRADTHYALAQVLVYLGRSSLAIEHLSEAVRRAPERGEIHLDLAVAYARQGDFGSAWKHIAEARSRGVEPPPELLRALPGDVSRSPGSSLR